LYDLSITNYAILSPCTIVQDLIKDFFLLVLIAGFATASVLVAREGVDAWRGNEPPEDAWRPWWVSVGLKALGSIFWMALAAALAAGLVFTLLNPTAGKQLEKPEGWNVFWLGNHVAIKVTSLTEVTVYGPYCKQSDS
jgi:hypothetical protein